VSDKAQTRLLTILTIVIFEALDKPLKKLVSEPVPERREARDDAIEALLQASARVIAVMVASGLIRQFVRQRG
jgi:hypothetical protein